MDVRLRVTGTFVTWGKWDNRFEAVVVVPVSFTFGDIIRGIPVLQGEGVFGYDVERVEVIQMI